MIVSNIIIPNKITEFKLEGNCYIKEIVDLIKDQYQNITDGVLWNFDGGDICDLDTADMLTFATTVKEESKHKKTAYFSSDSALFSLLQMYENLGKLEGVIPDTKVFLSYDDAIDWLTA